MYWFKLLVNAVCGHVYLWALFATVVDFSRVCAEESFRNFKANKEYFRCKTEGCSNKIFTVWSPYLLVVQYPSISIEAHSLGDRGFSYAVSGFGKKAGLKSGKIWKSFFTLLRRSWHPPWAKEVAASDKASRHTREKTSGTQGNGGPPCEQSLMGRKGGPAWIASNLWGRWSPNLWTSQSCSLSSNWFVRVQAPVYWETDGHNQARCSKHTAIRHILATCRACSTKILLDSCGVCLENDKIEQAKEKNGGPGTSEENSTVLALSKLSGERKNYKPKTDIMHYTWMFDHTSSLN